MSQVAQSKCRGKAHGAEPEKDCWWRVARDWYAEGDAGISGHGKLHHNFEFLRDDPQRTSSTGTTQPHTLSNLSSQVSLDGPTRVSPNIHDGCITDIISFLTHSRPNPSSNLYTSLTPTAPINPTTSMALIPFLKVCFPSCSLSFRLIL